MPERNEDELVGVFGDEQEAEAAARRVGDRTGEGSGVRVGDPRDEVASLEGEMREETSESFLSPQSGFLLTKEMAKGTRIGVPAATLLGALVALPFALIPFGDFSFVGRLITLAAIGATGGAVFGFILGAGLSAKGPRDPMAAEKGTTVAVSASDPEAREALTERRPLRVDKVSDGGQAAETVATDEEPKPGDTAKGIADTVKRDERSRVEDAKRQR